MFSIAYRMVGSVADAEDIVQEAWLRIHCESAAIRSLGAYATTVTTRLAIDHLRSARVRRERYVGEWLPEPLLASAAEADPAARTEAADTVSIAFLAMLERLSPVERAVFLLREVFRYDYGAIAGVVDKTELNCRRILTRARSHVQAHAPRFEVSPARRDALARRFFAACEEGDLAGLERVLAEDVQFHADGGGKAPAVRHPVTGRRAVARFLLGLLRHADASGQRILPTPVNGQPGALVVDRHGRPVAVFAVHIADGRVQALHNVMNPDKLRHLTTSLDGPARAA